MNNTADSILQEHTSDWELVLDHTRLFLSRSSAGTLLAQGASLLTNRRTKNCSEADILGSFNASNYMKHDTDTSC